jgi:hypothetical protein
MCEKQRHSTYSKQWHFDHKTNGFSFDKMTFQPKNNVALFEFNVILFDKQCRFVRERHDFLFELTSVILPGKRGRLAQPPARRSSPWSTSWRSPPTRTCSCTGVNSMNHVRPQFTDKARISRFFLVQHTKKGGIYQIPQNTYTKITTAYTKRP